MGIKNKLKNGSDLEAVLWSNEPDLSNNELLDQNNN